MTGKTPQFHLLANGNPKPENLLVSPLVQFDLEGKPVEKADAATIGTVVPVVGVVTGSVGGALGRGSRGEGVGVGVRAAPLFGGGVAPPDVAGVGRVL